MKCGAWDLGDQGLLGADYDRATYANAGFGQGGGQHLSPRKPAPIPFSAPGILIFGLVLATPSCLGHSEDLASCFQDPAFESIVVTAQEGLGPSPLPKHVVVVGAGMSDLVAPAGRWPPGEQALVYLVILHIQGPPAGMTACGWAGRSTGWEKEEPGPGDGSSFSGPQVSILEAADDYVGGRVVTIRNEEESWYHELGPMRTPKSQRPVHTYVKKLGLKLNKFTQYDGNTWYLTKRPHCCTREVKAHPEVLGYSANPTEKGNAETLSYQSTAKELPASPSQGWERTGSGLKSPGKLVDGPRSPDASPIPLCLTMSGHFQLQPFYDSYSTKITGGFDQLPKALSASLKPGTIHLGSKVETVVRAGPQVQISYQVGESNSSLHNLTADFIIISALAKATCFITFTPPLSLDKVDALRWVHYISATKVVLACEEPFWERDGIRGGVSITDWPSRYIYYPSHRLPSGKGVLLASYTLGNGSLFFTSMQHDQVVDIVLEDVHQIPKEELRRMCPSSVLKHWSLDPLFMGSVTQFVPHQIEDYLQRLFQPEGRIHFSGEHTSQPHGWTDAAIRSGLRVARDTQAVVDEEARGNRRPSPTPGIVSDPERKLQGNLQAAGWEVGVGGRDWGQVTISPPGPQTGPRSVRQGTSW
ncbi:LOW QUALITY PROTEIN: L-amino-acid oxidase-like [Molossus nigricans]